MKILFWKPLLSGVKKKKKLHTNGACTYRMLVLCITQHSPSKTHFHLANELPLKIKIERHAYTFFI